MQVSKVLRIPVTSFLQKLSYSSSGALKNLKEAKITIHNTGINYAETVGVGQVETNRRPILFLPGAFGSIEMDFKPIVAAMDGLSTKFKWIAYDPPGYGKSRPPKREFLSKEYDTVHEIDVKYILGLMDALGHQSCNFLAWSGAALSAIWIASEHPNRVSSLVTFGSFGRVEEKALPIIKMMKQKGLDAIPEGRRAKLLEIYDPEYLLEMWNGWCDEAVRMTYSEKYRSKAGTFDEQIRRVQCPTLVMQGTKDALVMMSQAEHLNENIKNSRLLLIKDGTHNLHLRNTKEFIQRVESFFEESEKK